MPKFYIIAFLYGCGGISSLDNDEVPGQGKQTSYEIAEELIPFYNSFKSVIGVDPKHIPASLVELENTIAGICITYNNNTKEIKINKYYWQIFTEDEKENLVFHELGHCALNLKHNEKFIDLGSKGKIPESIMYPFIFGNNWYYRDFRNYYHKGLR